MLLFIVIVFYSMGLFFSGVAIITSRTPQGATAWVMSLLFFPFLSVPLFVIFGRSRFRGYNTKRKFLDQKVIQEFRRLESIREILSDSEDFKLINATISKNNQPGFTTKNKIDLLINAEETYSSMLKELEAAQDYIVFQFYIFREDSVGMKFSEVLMRRAREGIRISFLHDDIGNDASKKLFKDFERAGIQVAPFNRTKLRGRFQINFRNHRKIIIIDGKVGFVGGLNIGDDYLGRWEAYGPWRDTHVRLEGPSVIAAQLASAKDWYCTKETALDVDWKIHPVHDQNAQILVLHTGPADDKHTCLLAHIAMINSANQRLWIANPYFVPPESLMDAILLASLRGIDVRVILPAISDAKTVQFASQVYQERLLDHGVRVYLHTHGFMHQKVMLVDAAFATVGSANFDCRSMFINFEITTIASDAKFVSDVAYMLSQDFENAAEITPQDFKNQKWTRKISTRGANLLAPIL
jgi:cardiolipin synthase A/B